MKNLMFILGEGVYPHKVGGMEVFNYYFIKNLRDKFNVSYISNQPLDFDGAKWFKAYKIRPTAIPIFISLMFRPSIKKVVISFSEAHWRMWYIYTKMVTLLKKDYYVIIHHGKSTPKDKPSVYKELFGKAKRVIAVSQDIKKNYDKEFGTDCEVLYPLVPFEECVETKEQLRAKHNIPVDANVICMVGTIKEMKHPETVIDAVSKFSKDEFQQYNPHIVYAGSGAMIESLKEKAKKLGIEERVHFMGFVPKEKVNRIFKMSDLYIIASDFEGTSVSLLEAMYNRKPIIASCAPGINDMVVDGKSGLQFKIGKEDEVKKHIITLLDQPELAKSLSENAYRFFEENYSYEDMLNSYIKIFNE